MTRKQMLLIAEDNVVNRKILKNMLQNEYEILEAYDGQQAIEILSEKEENITAILLDIVMPVKDGYDVLHFMKSHNIEHIPVVVMTGESDGESEEKALDLGAWDFVPKPYKPKVLMTRLKNAIARSRMNYLAQITHIAEHDQLTDLYNRRHFYEITEKMIKEHRNEAIAFIRMDINQFRLVNSFLGEKGGDKLLVFIANELRKRFKRYPWYVYGRIQSDVFGICIPYQKEQCEADIQEMINQLSAFNKEYLIEPSFGIYLVEDDNLSVEKMFLCATLAAKECKGKYMIYFSYYSNHMSEELEREQEITYEMQRALDNEEFIIFFQPKYETQTQKPYGAEALVRWKHPQKGMISPGLFIPVFERNGFIGKLDYYVWNKVCQYIRNWLDNGIYVTPISVNMSRAELSNPNLVDMVIELVDTYKIPAELLNLELTESAYMDNPEAMIKMIHKLHEKGFTILMDDFGSGYSSLNTLKDLDVDILKIDMKFLTLDETNVKSRKILESIITMARWIGLPVITEGVETEEQYLFLKKIRCEYIQGYYFSRPISYEAYDELIRNQENVNEF